MKRLEFNKENAEKYGVETRDGRPARVLCWDLKNYGEKIVAAISNECREYAVTVSSNGRYLNGETECEEDLVIKFPRRWRAEKGEKYYAIDYIIDGFIVVPDVDYRTTYDDKQYKRRNYFATETDAKKYADYLNGCVEKFFSKKKMNREITDGIYLIKKTGKPVLFTPGCDKKNCVAVGIKMGDKHLAVALKDAADGENITLTDSKYKTKYDGYIDNRTDAVGDWNGKANTEHLKAIGLNKDIKLEAGQYIPAVGEMYLIYLHKKALNEALEAVGGEPISNDWYWTSTEGSATGAWFLSIGNGYIANDAKAMNVHHVRPVSAFKQH